jgi:hypothetical protein
MGTLVFNASVGSPVQPVWHLKPAAAVEPAYALHIGFGGGGGGQYGVPHSPSWSHCAPVPFSVAQGQICLQCLGVVYDGNGKN